MTTTPSPMEDRQAEVRRWLQILADTQSRADKRAEFQAHVETFDGLVAAVRIAAEWFVENEYVAMADVMKDALDG